MSLLPGSIDHSLYIHALTCRPMKRICLLLETLSDATTAVNERIGQIEKAGGVITDIKFQPASTSIVENDVLYNI